MPQTAYLPVFNQAPLSRFTLDYQVGLYLANDLLTHYVHRTGQAAVPVAGPDGTPPKFVKNHAAFGGKVVRFVMARYGLMPLCPGLELSDPNIVYLGGEVWVNAPAIATDGYAYIYRIEGYYVYAFKTPVWVNTTGGLPIGSTTIDRTIPAQNVMPTTAFVDPATAWKVRAPGDDPTLYAVGSGSLVPPGTVQATAASAIKLGPNIIAN